MLFTNNRGSLCIFVMIVGIEPTAFCLRDRRSTNELYQPTTMCWLSCCILFWNTQYNTPCTFCFAGYSVVFRDRCCPASFPTAPLTTKTAYKPLVATPRTNTLPFLIPINWTGLVVKSAPPVTFHLLTFLASQRLSKRSFHNFQRHCYLHPSLNEGSLTGVSRLV